MYHLLYGIFYLVSLLPLRILYLISDFAYFLIYYIIRYRRDVVMENLRYAFPERSEADLTKIAKDFYLSFTDNFIEIIKMVSASEKFMARHFKADVSVLDSIYAQGRSCNILLGHNFNWEWANYAISMRTKFRFLVVYMPINSKAMDRLFITLRQRGNTSLLSAQNMRRDFMQYRNELYALVLAADQNPGDPKFAYWLNFFGRPAPFVTGPEKGVRPQNIPAVFAQFKKIKRGYYHLQLSLLSDTPQELPEGELTRRFVRSLEDVIREDPHLWLWSHKRWKHKWDGGYAKRWVDEVPPPAA